MSHLPALAIPPGLDSTVRLSNLPSLHSDFIGRQEELAKVTACLTEARLITLTGIGGVGKSRLAIQAAALARPRFRDGVCYLSLIPLDSPELLAPSLLAALDIPCAEQAAPEAHLLNVLRERELLLVLDNFEHLLPETDLVADILRQAGGVTLLVTSRERLNLKGERLFPVGGLSLSEAEAVEGSDALQLFLQSARKVCPDFSFHAQNREAAWRICRLVDGMALALELAGSWVRALSCAEIAAEIESSPDFLASAWADQPERHRSLRTIFEHSWRMLDAEQQQTFRRLAVFSGGFDREASRQVTGASAAGLASLVDRSFLAWDPARERYDLHPVLKHYAEDRLAENPEETACLRDRHSRYFCMFLQEREEGSGRQNPVQALREIGAELPNIRAAWHWAATTGKGEYLGDSLEALCSFFVTRGRHAEGVSLFSTTAEILAGRPEALPGSARLIQKLHARRASMWYELGMPDAAYQGLTECLQAAEQAADDPEIVFCQLALGFIIASKLDFPRAKRLIGAALETAVHLGLRQAEGLGHRHQALIAMVEGDYGLAQPHYQRALQIYQETQNRRGENMVLYGLGMIARRRGEIKAAIAYHEKALSMCRELEDIRREGLGLFRLGSLYLDLCQYAEALEAYERALSLMQRAEDKRMQASLINSLGSAYARLGSTERAQAYLARALATSRTEKWQGIEHDALCLLGCLQTQQGNYGEAEAASRAALEIVGGVPDEKATDLAALGEALLGLGRLEEAEAALREALAIRREIGQAHLLASTLANLAAVELARGNRAEALRLVEPLLPELEGEGGGDEFGRVYWVCYQVLVAANDPRAETVLRAAHDTLQSVAARIEGAELRRAFLENIPAHQAILQAFSQQNRITTATVLADQLTHQELEVLRLIVAGLSNQAIAERLVITVGTVKSHIHSIYEKLDVENRSQAISRAHEFGLR